MKVSILIPTYNRPQALTATLTALLAQTRRDFELIIADQSEQPVREDPAIASICRIFETHGNSVRLLRNLPRRGMAQQRQFLLDQAQGQFSLFLDDDVILEADVLECLCTALQEEQCGFAGMALIGLSYKDDFRPHEQHLELWQGPVQPEVVRPHDQKWQRHSLHNAANILHAGEQLPGQHKYKVAWVGGCVLYDTEKLHACGGFQFWQSLPEEHCGEDVLAQLRMLERYGGFGLLPSRAYHLELPTTIHDRRINAPEFFLAPQTDLSQSNHQ